MPTINGRLICCSCGADLGSADDPYRDPDCWQCLRREYEEYTDEAESVTLCMTCEAEISDEPDALVCPACHVSLTVQAAASS